MASPPSPTPPSAGNAERAPGPGVELQKLRAISGGLRELAATDWSAAVSGSARDLVRELEQIMRTTTAIQADVLAAAETSGKWALDGQRNFDSWVTSQTGSTRGTAGKAVRLSKSLQDDLPATRQALAQGTISSDHAQIIAQRCTKTDKQLEKLADPERGEEYLLRQAQEMDATKFAKVANSWAIETDPEAADRRWRKETAKEEVSLAPTTDGYTLYGWLNPASGALLDEALRAHMGRRSAEDLRPYNERRADALIALAAQSLDAGFQMPTARIRPHLTVTVEYDTLRRLVEASGPIMPASDTESGAAFGLGEVLDESEWAKSWKPGDEHVISTSLDYTQLQGAAPAQLPDGTPIPHKVLARFTCESMLARVIFGPDSTVLNVGREQRIFTAHQTRAIIARDRTCRYPGCDEPPGFGEIHHSISWAKHKGNTDVDLGILLCYRHHDLVHERDISITRRRGEWIFTSRHGRVIDPPGHSSPASSGELPPPSRSPGGTMPSVPPDESRASPRRRDSGETTRRPTSRVSQMRTAPPPREDSSSSAGNRPRPPRISSVDPRARATGGLAAPVAREKELVSRPPDDPVSEGQLW